MVNAGITAETLTAVAASTIKQWQQADESNRDVEREIFATRIQDLETEASFHTAKAPAAALYQLGIARSHSDMLMANYVRDRVGENIFRNLDRLLIQVTRYIEATSGVTREQAGLIYYSDPANEGYVFGESRTHSKQSEGQS